MNIKKVEEILRKLEHIEITESGNKVIDAALSNQQVRDTARQICELEAKPVCDHVFEQTTLYARKCVDCGLEQEKIMGEVLFFWHNKQEVGQ